VTFALHLLVVGNKILGKLIQRVIGEMRQQILLGINIITILAGGKPGQPILIDINPEWIIASNAHINSHIKLQPINQQRINNILTDHHGLLLFLKYLFRLVGDPDSLSLGFVRGLYYVPLF
jgi:hypothetical protein